MDGSPCSGYVPCFTLSLYICPIGHVWPDIHVTTTLRITERLGTRLPVGQAHYLACLAFLYLVDIQITSTSSYLWLAPGITYSSFQLTHSAREYNGNRTEHSCAQTLQPWSVSESTFIF